jgi:hypothetical protein
MKKFIAFVLSAMIISSVVPFSVTAFAAESKKAAVSETVEDSSGLNSQELVVMSTTEPVETTAPVEPTET